MKNTNKSRRPYPPERVFLGLPRQLPVAFSRPSPLTAFLLRLAESPRSTLSASSICYQKSHVLSGFFSIVPKQSKLNNADGRTPRLSFSLRGRARAPPPLPPTLTPLTRRAASEELRGCGGSRCLRNRGRKEGERGPTGAACVGSPRGSRAPGREGAVRPRRPPRRGLAAVGSPPPLSVLHH